MDFQRVCELAVADPGALKELEKTMEPICANLNQLNSDLSTKKLAIAEKRWASGQYEVLANDGPMPEPLTAFDAVQTSVVFDKASGKDIRRLVRIYAGQDAAVDALLVELDLQKKNAQRTADAFLAARGH